MVESRPEEFNYDADTSCAEAARLPEFIRQRAYELFEERGQQPGHEVEDWLQAERELKHHWGIQ